MKNSEIAENANEHVVAIAERMATVKYKIMVLSGKCGVGMSTFSTQLAFARAAMNFQVDHLDIDICGLRCLALKVKKSTRGTLACLLSKLSPTSRSCQLGLCFLILMTLLYGGPPAKMSSSSNS